MRPIEIEAWVLRVVDQVKKGQPNEDRRVELKAEWIEPPEKAARQIAGHANAARGSNILWIIGLDEK
jgi:hypothetical protein